MDKKDTTSLGISGDALPEDALKKLIKDGLDPLSITSLGYRHDDTGAVCEMLSRFANLDCLYICGTATRLPRELYGLGKLRRLTLWMTKLEAVSPDITQLENLETLRLSVTGDDLTTLPIEIISMKKPVIIELGLVENIFSLPSAFNELVKRYPKYPPDYDTVENKEDYLDDYKYNIRELKKVIKRGAALEIDPNASPVFQGQRWCITGTLKKYKPREKAEQLIRSGGGLFSTKIDKTATHLLAGGKSGEDNLEKAKKLKIEIVTEDEFAGMLNKKVSAAPGKKITLTDTAKKDAIIAAVRKMKWDCGADEIISRLRHSISMDTTDGKPATGQSKLGGKPDLPRIFKWPWIYDEEQDEDETLSPLTFIAQFNIADFKRLDYDNLLPDRGILYLFMYQLRDGIQDDYTDGGEDKWLKMLYFPGAADGLKPAGIPSRLKNAEEDGLAGSLEEYALSFKEDYSFPDGDEFERKLSQNDKNNLKRIREEVVPGVTQGRTGSHIFGYPQPVQDRAAREKDFFFQMDDCLGSFDGCIEDGAFFFFAQPREILLGRLDNIRCLCEFT